MFIRWLKFNAVGAAGVVVQIGSLWMLIELGGLHYLAATIIATELAVLHNFIWHGRWTWADRPAPGFEPIVRLIRFNLTNGVVSLAGNALLMWLLSGLSQIPYLPANLASIAGCSLLNFFLSEGFVFAPAARPAKARRILNSAFAPRSDAFARR